MFKSFSKLFANQGSYLNLDYR